MNNHQREFIWIEKEFKLLGLVLFRWIGKQETTLSLLKRLHKDIQEGEMENV